MAGVGGVSACPSALWWMGKIKWHRKVNFPGQKQNIRNCILRLCKRIFCPGTCLHFRFQKSFSSKSSITQQPNLSIRNRYVCCGSCETMPALLHPRPLSSSFSIFPRLWLLFRGGNPLTYKMRCLRSHSVFFTLVNNSFNKYTVLLVSARLDRLEE